MEGSTPTSSVDTKTFSVLQPWKNDNGPRDLIRTWTRKRWSEFFPNAQWCEGTNDDEPFNRGAARNSAFEQADNDLIVILDADTFQNPDATIEGLALVGTMPWVLPYTTYYNLSEAQTVGLLEGPTDVTYPEDLDDFEHKLRTSISGILLMTKDVYREARGYDERFIGYGWEDNAFVAALTGTAGPVCRVDRAVFHMWHPLAGDPFQHPHKEHNRSLWQEYERRAYDHELMKRYLEERDG